RGAPFCHHAPPRAPGTCGASIEARCRARSRSGSAPRIASSLREHRCHPRRPARAAHHGGAAPGGAARQGAPVSDGEAAVPVAVTVTSFGFKFGLPPEAGWVFDARVVRNPFWVAELRSYTGLDGSVRDYVLEDPV